MIQLLSKYRPFVLNVVGLSLIFSLTPEVFAEKKEPDSGAALFKSEKRQPKFEFKDKTIDEQRWEYESKAKLAPRDLSLFFDPKENKVEFPEQSIDYDLTSGTILRIGPLDLPAQSISMALTRETGERIEIEFGLELKKRTHPIYVLSFTWPLEYMSSGVIEIIDDDNITQWRTAINPSDNEKWRKRVGHISEVHKDSQYGLVAQEFLQIPVWQIKKPFRFCLSQDSADGRLALCSKRYRFLKHFSRYELKAHNNIVRPRVFVNDQPVTLKGSAIFLENESPIKFAALLNDGSYYEFIARPKPINILDMVRDEEKKVVSVIGYGHPPMGNVEVIRRSDRDFWDFFNFMPTIGDLRNFWRATYPDDKPYLYLRGYGGAPFKQAFVYDALPTEKARIQLKAKSPQSTYSGVLRLHGTKSPAAKVSSRQQKATNDSDGTFTWEFLAPQKGEYNRSRIQVREGGHQWNAYYEVWRGFPLEISSRVTGVVSDTFSVILLGEASAQLWFESLFGWQNRTYSLHRWGVASRYFQSLAGFGGKEGSSLIKLNVMNADLKYRLTPGVWGRDATLGLMLSAQHVQIQDYQAPMVGGGVFWARSMPSFFNVILDVVPFMRYPKWVDVEFVAYPMSLDPNYQAAVNMAVNFHGKIEWTPRFFGEAGFGLKIFDFAALKQEKKIGLGMAYGTFGLGLNF